MSKEGSAYDVIVVGGGASGLMCAIAAGNRGLRVLVLEKNAKPGLKILVSGGGRCNFTNTFADPREHYLSDNPHFCISAMNRYTPQDFVELVEDAGIAHVEKAPGQLFCANGAQDILDLLLQHCQSGGVELRVKQEVVSVDRAASGLFTVRTAEQSHKAAKVVLAAGGLSMPKIASDLAFRVAGALALKIISPRAALVPLRWSNPDAERYRELSGISVPASVTCSGTTFAEPILFTHRGLSGPGILQASSYWREGDTLSIDLLPDEDAAAWLLEQRERDPQQRLVSTLRAVLPRRLVDVLTGHWFADTKLGSPRPAELQALGEKLNHWRFKPNGSEGYRTAEVTLGGIDTSEVSSRTFELKACPGLHVIGEALDVTGWLGGYNFQWAWASGWCCGQHV